MIYYPWNDELPHKIQQRLHIIKQRKSDTRFCLSGIKEDKYKEVRNRLKALFGLIRDWDNVLIVSRAYSTTDFYVGGLLLTWAINTNRTGLKLNSDELLELSEAIQDEEINDMLEDALTYQILVWDRLELCDKFKYGRICSYVQGLLKRRQQRIGHVKDSMKRQKMILTLTSDQTEDAIIEKALNSAFGSAGASFILDSFQTVVIRSNAPERKVIVV